MSFFAVIFVVIVWFLLNIYYCIWITRDNYNIKMGLPKAEFLSPTQDQIQRLRSDFFERLDRDGAPCEGILFQHILFDFRFIF